MGKRQRGLRDQGRALQSAARKKQRRVPDSTIGQHKNKATRVLRSPYHPHHRLLLLGEGDFSFAHSLIASPPSRTFTPLLPSHITATCYDSFTQTTDKYPDAQPHLDALRAAGVQLWDRVDCTCLHVDGVHFPSPAPSPPFDFVVFNFPHTGQHQPDPALNRQHHRAFLSAFLSSLLSSPLLHPHLTVHLTLKTGEPYTSWRVPTLLPPTSPLAFRRAFPFHPSTYPLYRHRRTRGWREEDGSGEDNGDIDGGAMTYEWRVRGSGTRGTMGGEGEEVVRGRGGEEEEVEEERRRLQEEVRRVVSVYDTTHETTLPALDEERETRGEKRKMQPSGEMGEAKREHQGGEAAWAGSRRSTELGSSAEPQPPPPAQLLGAVKKQRSAAGAAAAAAHSPASTVSTSTPAMAAPRLVALPPRPQRKAPKLRQLLF